MAFVILALPRSRTKWLSTFLSPPGRTCGHDLVAESDGARDFLTRLEALDGSCETAAMYGWNRIYEEGHQLLVVKRNLLEVQRSLARFGLDWDDLPERNHQLDLAVKVTGCPVFEYHELKSQDVCEMIYQHCLGLTPQQGWWEYWDKQNVQIDMVERLVRNQINLARINRTIHELREG